ncbi:LysR family transcriptional regulator [Paenibacillus athensensis]|uniref:LysR family transcriptional regulator n=1 Tax=Paenibacillus athensensis TaxID=1967502 RepID=A0A4Y8Q3Y0_9BACL|nr:LysR family transcriptional regulator [Paenibacillus athensensis]MCD1258390.1 LysR family transcriptional regulator [Paenibacillus athensensis]
MDLRQLRYFLTVAEEGQVTGAAKLLNMEQPPLSRQLKLMEQELGVQLFDRSGNRLKLTQAGALLRVRAETLLRQFHETVQEVKELDAGVQGVLSIGTAVSCISLLPDKIRRFGEQYPRVSFKIQEGDHFLLGELLEQRQIELVVTRLPFEAASGAERYAELKLPSDPFVALLPQDWGPPAPANNGDTAAISLKELARHPFLTLKTDHTFLMHEQVMNEFRQSSLAPHVLCECSSVAVILSFVAAGIGATVLPKSVTSSFPLAGIRLLDIADAQFESQAGLVWLADRYLSTSARRFIDSFQP